MREEQTLPEMPEREAFTAAYMAACKNRPADWNEIGYWYARQLWQAGFNAGIAEGGKDAYRLRHAGAMLSNCAFNLAQRNPGQFTARDIEALDSSRKAWDAAIRPLPTPPAAMPNKDQK